MKTDPFDSYAHKPADLGKRLSGVWFLEAGFAFFRVLGTAIVTEAPKQAVFSCLAPSYNAPQSLVKPRTAVFARKPLNDAYLGRFPDFSSRIFAEKGQI